MKNSLRHITFAAAGLVAAALTGRAAEEPRAAATPEKKEMRVIVGSGDGTPRAGLARTDRGVVVHRVGREGEKESVTFLGVETSPVSATLNAQLALPNGSGLVVAHIVPDSPAAGVLKEHDILLKLDDQILIEARQLSVLIRNHKEGDEVALTYLRGGKQATAKLKLAKHDVPKMSGLFERAVPGGEFGMGSGSGRFEMLAPRAAGESAEVDHLLSMIQRAPNGEPMRIQIDRNGGPGFRAMSINTGNSNLVFSDDEGSLDISIKDGKKTLVAKDPKGEQVFSGPVTTPEERKAIPARVRERLEKVEGMHNITFRTDGNFQGTEMKVMRPMGRGISMPAPAPLPPRPPLFF